MGRATVAWLLRALAVVFCLGCIGAAVLTILWLRRSAEGLEREVFLPGCRELCAWHGASFLGGLDYPSNARGERIGAIPRACQCVFPESAIIPQICTPRGQEGRALCPVDFSSRVAWYEYAALYYPFPVYVGAIVAAVAGCLLAGKVSALARRLRGGD